MIRWSARERAYVAKAPGLSGCIGTGDTYQAALQSCLEAMQWRAERAAQRGHPLPPAEFSWAHHIAAEETEHSTGQAHIMSQGTQMKELTLLRERETEGL